MRLIFSLMLSLLLVVGISQPNVIHVSRTGSSLSVNQAASSINASSSVVDFEYSITTTSPTSAGIFTSEGTLIKTLWNNEKKDPGTYNLGSSWDGTNDIGSVVSDGNYQFKLVSGNIQNEWNIIGNTSDYKSGSTVHHSQDVVTGMCFTNSTIYYSVGYNEGAESIFKSNISMPNQKLHYKPGFGASILYECTDGEKVYYAGSGFQADNTQPSGVNGTQFTYATTISDDQPYIFPNGVSTGVIFSALTYSAIDVTISNLYNGDPNDPNVPECSIGGFAVQQSGNYLFVSYFDRNEIHVLDKNTGTLIQNITDFTLPKSLAVDRDDDNAIWICSSNNTVAKYTINSNGTLSDATLTLSGLVKPLCVATKYGTVAVMDGSSKQQVRFFNNVIGAEGEPVGQEGGYVNSSVVAPDKFMFKNTKAFFREDRNNFIAFDLSGGLWVGDRGNYRVQHFSSSNEFIESVMNIGYHYSVQMEKSDPTKVYANYLQFSVNYSNFNWTLTNNWAFNITEEFDNQFERLRSVTTLSNGRTYALAKHTFQPEGQSYIAHRWQIVELVPNGNLRFTGIEPSYTGEQFDVFYSMNSDGSLLRLSNTSSGLAASWLIQRVTGFDNDNNPVYSASEVLASIPAVSDYDPITGNGIQPDQITEDSVIGTFNYELTTYMHLGGIKIGSSNWNFLSSPSTKTRYNGDFPNNGDYDIGNGVNYQGSSLQAAGNYFAYGNHGENWKMGQIDIVNIYTSDGLFLYQVGLPQGKAQILGEAPAGYAGNAVATIFRKLTSDKYVLVANDEAQHGAIRFFMLTGFESINTQIYTITKSETSALLSNSTNNDLTNTDLTYTDLMEGLPPENLMIESTAGWIMNPTPYFHGGYDNWSMRTGFTVYKPADKSLRLGAYPITNDQTYTCTHAITSSAYNSWKITGAIGYPEPGEPDYNYFDILDNDDRVIVRLTSPYISNINYFRANDTDITSDLTDIFFSYIKSQTQPFSIVANNDGSITVTYANYAPVTVGVQDPQADITHPAKIRVQFYNDLQRGHALDMENLKFYPIP